MNELAPALLTQGGVALFTTILIGLLVKTPLRLRFNIEDGVVPDPKSAAWYSWALNLSAVAIAELLAIAAVLILGDTTGASILEAVLMGFLGGASAVGFNEFGSNTSAAFRK